MNQRDLSEKLEELATSLENLDNVYQAHEIAVELRRLSNENYAPGSSLSWDAVKPKPVKKAQGGFFSKNGKRTPF